MGQPNAVREATGAPPSALAMTVYTSRYADPGMLYGLVTVLRLISGMVGYRRVRLAGASYFFTVTLRDRGSDMVVARADDLRAAVRDVRRQHPFTIEAAVILPDHLHMIWTLPSNDFDGSGRWRAIKSRFSQRWCRAAPTSAGTIAASMTSGNAASGSTSFRMKTISAGTWTTFISTRSSTGM